MTDPARQFVDNIRLFESFSPYYLFFRRGLILILLISIAVGLYSTGLNEIAVAIITGLMIGPVVVSNIDCSLVICLCSSFSSDVLDVLGLERYLVLKALQRRKQSEG